LGAIVIYFVEIRTQDKIALTVASQRVKGEVHHECGEQQVKKPGHERILV
jgi:hypothetical protein